MLLMIDLNTEAPRLSLPGVQAGQLGQFKLPASHREWTILFFYPADFTFVCPTEIVGFNPDVTFMTSSNIAKPQAQRAPKTTYRNSVYSPMVGLCSCAHRGEKAIMIGLHGHQAPQKCHIRVNKRHAEIKKGEAQIWGISTDGIESHRQWAEELDGIDFPLLSDTSASTCRDYGVLNEDDGRAYRATIIVTPEGRIAYSLVSPMNVGRSVDETIRVLAALRTGRLCPADWRPGEQNFDSELKY